MKKLFLEFLRLNTQKEIVDRGNNPKSISNQLASWIMRIEYAAR